MLDHVERWRFLVDPAGKDPAPLVVGALDVELEERARQLLLLPRRGHLAGAQVDDRIAGANRHARLHFQVMDDAVALVEKADDRDPVLHRSHARLVALEHLAGVARLQLVLARLLASAAREGERQRDRECSPPDHCYSGVQGW
jgi:hypothetical protein